VDTYHDWKDVPEHLKTSSALKKLGLRPKRGQAPAAQKTHWDYKIPTYDLFDMRECEPYTVSDAQKAALQKARANSLEARTCTRCGWVENLGRPYRGKPRVIDGLCPLCRERDERERDRAEAVEWAQRMLSTPGALILDTETTDLDGEIIELAILTVQDDVVFNSRFHNSEQIHPKAQAIHGLSAAHLADAPLFKDQILTIAGHLLTAPVTVIYNAAFDVARINYTCHLYGFGSLQFKHQCAMLWYAQWVGEWSNYHGSYRFQPLEEGDHSALGDCRATLSALKEMAEAAL